MNAHTDRDLMLEARLKAQRLTEALHRQQAELTADAGRLSPVTAARGQAAMQDAVSSAERLLATIEAALAS